MKRLAVVILGLVLLLFILGGCASAKKNRSELRGLMLLDNLQMPRNKAFNSKHSIKVRNDAFRKYRKNSRNV